MKQQLLQVAEEALATTLDDVDPEGLPALLESCGWEFQKETAVGRRENWTCGDVVGSLELLEEPRRFSSQIRIIFPQDDTDFNMLYPEFLELYRGEVDTFTARFGEARLVSVNGDNVVPVQTDFSRASVWFGEAYGVVIGFQHEDQEAPVRVAVHIFECPTVR